MALKLTETTVEANNDDGSFPFVFDNVFGTESAQKDVFDAVGVPLVEDILEGYNATIFAYGQTGSGKTHTMMGPSIGDEHLAGIIPRTVGALFEGIAGADANIEFVIKVSYVEIYMERIRDLLDPSHVRDNLAVRRARNAASSLPRLPLSTAHDETHGVCDFAGAWTRPDAPRTDARTRPANYSEWPSLTVDFLRGRGRGAGWRAYMHRHTPRTHTQTHTRATRRHRPPIGGKAVLVVARHTHTGAPTCAARFLIVVIDHRRRRPRPPFCFCSIVRAVRFARTRRRVCTWRV